jgi:hypothetical protein
MAGTPSAPRARRLTVELPRELYGWLQEAAEISHRTLDVMVTDLIERERERWDANGDPGREDGTPTE